MVVTTDASSFGWGGWWRPFGLAGKLKDEARGFWLPSEEGMSSNAWELCGVKLTIKAGLEHFGKPGGAGGDRQQGNLGLCQPSGWPVTVLEQHRSGPLVNVLSDTHPTCRSPPPRQGQ